MSFLDIVVVVDVVVVVFNFQFSFHIFFVASILTQMEQLLAHFDSFPFPTASFFIVFRISHWNYSKNNEKQYSRMNVFLCWWSGVSFSHNAISIMLRFEMCGSSAHKKDWVKYRVHTVRDKRWMYVKTKREKTAIHKQIGQTNIISMVFCYMRIQDSRIERATTAWCKLHVQYLALAHTSHFSV